MSDDMMSLFEQLDDSVEVLKSRETFIRAPFAYPGGKSRSIDKILDHLPYRSSYIEPFGGSASILLARHKSPLEVYNDRFGGVVSFYRCLRDPEKFKLLTDRLSLIVHAREEFIWCRDTWENCDDDVERAARWYYASVFSFSSLGRFFGRSTSAKSQQGSKIAKKIEHFPEIHERIKDVIIENMDAMLLIKDFDNQDAVMYLDPPYMHEQTHGALYNHELKTADHIKLLNIVFGLKAYVAVSSYPNPVYEGYPWDETHEWEVTVSTKAMAFQESNHFKGQVAKERSSATEKLYIKYEN